MKSSQEAKPQNSREAALMLPVTAGMIALAYNIPGVNSEIRLPRDVYVDIFAGVIKRWDDPRIKAANPGLGVSSSRYRACRSAGQQRHDSGLHETSRRDRLRLARRRHGRGKADRLAEGDDACARQ